MVLDESSDFCIGITFFLDCMGIIMSVTTTGILIDADVLKRNDFNIDLNDRWNVDWASLLGMFKRTSILLPTLIRREVTFTDSKRMAVAVFDFIS